MERSLCTVEGHSSEPLNLVNLKEKFTVPFYGCILTIFIVSYFTSCAMNE